MMLAMIPNTNQKVISVPKNLATILNALLIK